MWRWAWALLTGQPLHYAGVAGPRLFPKKRGPPFLENRVLNLGAQRFTRNGYRSKYPTERSDQCDAWSAPWPITMINVV